MPGDPLNPHPPSWTLLTSDGAPVECAGGIRESLGGPDCTPWVNCLSPTASACSASCIISLILAYV